MRIYTKAGDLAFEKARRSAGKSGMSQIIFRKGSKFVIVARGDGTRDTCIYTGEALGWTFYKEVQVLK